MKKASAKNYYALLCDCGTGKNRYMICGVAASRKEARAINMEILGCVGKHTIKKVDVTIKWK